VVINPSPVRSKLARRLLLLSTILAPGSIINRLRSALVTEALRNGWDLESPCSPSNCSNLYRDAFLLAIWTLQWRQPACRGCRHWLSDPQFYRPFGACLLVVDANLKLWGLSFDPAFGALELLEQHLGLQFRRQFRISKIVAFSRPSTGGFLSQIKRVRPVSQPVKTDRWMKFLCCVHGFVLPLDQSRKVRVTPSVFWKASSPVPITTRVTRKLPPSFSARRAASVTSIL